MHQHPHRIPDTILYKQVDRFSFGANFLDNLISALYLQLVMDVITNRAQNEHIAPLINRLKSKKYEIEKLFSFDGEQTFWEKNVVVVNLHDVNLEMKKTIPLLLAKRLYEEQKSEGKDRTLSLIIDEAHNILSKQSSREAETWKDYRLETFEEIIKEGRKFGVFVTLASQRPSDISPTIASQAHNYFIHRLINQTDLNMIASAVSYVDRVTEESIPTLPTGTCVFSGVVTQIPLKIHVRELDTASRPTSATKKFSDMVPLLAAD
jgi:DNA helicase HerA-like ATPase